MMEEEIWSKFVLEGRTNINLRREILESWNRCKQLGISHEREEVFSHISQDDFDRRRQRNQDLINAALQVMKDFNKVLNGEGYLFLIVDAEGYIVEMLTDKPSRRAAEHSGITVGARWLEEDVGTTGLSIVLRTRTAIATSGKEHYCLGFRSWDCSACPIFVDGTFLGAFDVCRLGPKNDLRELYTLAVSGARTISERYQLNKSKMKEKVLSHVLTKYVPKLGILASDNQGIELYKNKSADDFLKLFGENNEQLGLNEKNIVSGLDKDFPSTELEVNENNFSIQTEEIISQGKQLATLTLIHPHTKEILSKANSTQDLFTLNTKNTAFQKTLQTAMKVSRSDASILIQGESGVGKDFMARFIHKQSERRDHPYTAINCAALPRELITTELFGYEGGAFTGAKHKGNKGKIEASNKGTVFLDEIADLPLDLQATLLRVLEEKQVVRVGGTTPIPVDVHFLAATNKNMKELVETEKFREDLYYRLNVLTIKIPSLRERIEDLEVIMNAMLSEACEKVQRKPISFTSSAMSIFKEHTWPGNLRELRNVIERIVYLHDGEHFDSFHAREFLEVDQSTDKTSEREYLSYILHKTNGNRSKAAKEIGISRSALYRKLKKYNIE
ncbi:sigma-54-dependent Fis family transcriptional regulator [Alteribacillus sp. JSM 102045]|uniref:sigma-54-dependent Fis family transcriptional regulator n=1 Tax=Alteribacillus sp. JSM 102045 TaxID=1562101 RepID=UPI0035BF269B